MIGPSKSPYVTEEGRLSAGSRTGDQDTAEFSHLTAGTSNGSGEIPLMCFVRGTFIDTTTGPVAVETLTKGDLVETLDNGPQPVRWIASRKLSASELTGSPHLRPIRISAGALSPNIPSADLVVSPQHRILSRSKIVQRMFGIDEVLVAAKQLLDIDGVDVAEDVGEVEYFHILFDRHELVIANGAETESLYTGPQALRALDQIGFEEIFEIFPTLRHQGAHHLLPSARPLASGRKSRKLAVRHAKNQLSLVS